jgi:hypothetical protein
MSRQPLYRCVKCRNKTLYACHYCGDALCTYHSRIDEFKKRICPHCDAKLYLCWLQAKEYEHTTEMELQEWLKRESEREAAIG